MYCRNWFFEAIFTNAKFQCTQCAWSAPLCQFWCFHLGFVLFFPSWEGEGPKQHKRRSCQDIWWDRPEKKTSKTWAPPKVREQMNLLEWKGHSWSNSWNSKVFSEQLSELHSRPNYETVAEYCFESTVSEKRTHWVLRQTRWVRRKTRWVRFSTQIIGWEELTKFAPRNSVSPEKLTELGVWNRTPRNRIRPVSD